MILPAEVDAWRVALAGPPTSFVLDGESYELTAPWSALLASLPLVDWHMPLLYDMLHPADADALDDRLEDIDDDLTLIDVRAVVERLVELATGRRWWVAQRLYATLAADWQQVEGTMTAAGVDLAALLTAPARVCNLVYVHLTRGADPQRLIIFDAKLNRPPAGLDTRTTQVVTPEQEGAAFMAAMAGTKGGRIGARA